MTHTTAGARWRSALESWRLPDHLLAAVTDITYQSPPALWRRARLVEARHGAGETRSILEGLLGPRGSLLDVGAGTGRISLPLAAAGWSVTAVEPDPAMAEGFRGEAQELGVEAELVEDTWPAAAAAVGSHDVVLCANVVYNVADLDPFLCQLHRSARHAVVIELTPTHPWTHLAPYYEALHGHRLPTEPCDGLFVEAVAEILGVEPLRSEWMRGGVHRFADLQELVAYYGRRLLVPAERADDLLAVLAPDVSEEEGWLVLGDPVRRSVTVWWPTS